MLGRQSKFMIDNHSQLATQPDQPSTVSVSILFCTENCASIYVMHMHRALVHG